jgi:hypothetical protein
LPFDTGGLAKARRQTAEQARALVEELATDHRWTGLVHERVSRSRAHTIGRIVGAVIGLVDRAGYCWASAETIAGYAGCDRSTVFRLWPEIEFSGLLVSERQAHGPNRVYLGATLIDRMLALLNTPGWATNPASPFWLRYRQWLGQSVAYRHSRGALEPSALKSRLNLLPNCLEHSDQQIQRSQELAEPGAFPPQSGEGTTATPTGKGTLRPALRSGPCLPSLGRETEPLSGGGNVSHTGGGSAEQPRSPKTIVTPGRARVPEALQAVLERWPAVASRLDERCLRNLVAFRHELRRIDQVLAMADAQPIGSFWRGVSAWVTMALKRNLQPNRHQQAHFDAQAQARRLQRDGAQAQGTAEPPSGIPSPSHPEVLIVPSPATAPDGRSRPATMATQTEEARAPAPDSPKLSPLAQLLRASPNLPAAMRARWQALVRAPVPPPAATGLPGPSPRTDTPDAPIDLVALFAAAANAPPPGKRRRRHAAHRRRHPQSAPGQLSLVAQWSQLDPQPELCAQPLFPPKSGAADAPA